MSATTPTTVYQRWSAPGPRAASHRLVDDRHRRRLAAVRERKEAASQQRCPEGGEEIRADLGPGEPRAPGHRSVVGFDREDLFPGVTDEQIADDPGALHPRNRLDLFEDTVVKVGPLRGGAGRFASRRRVQGRGSRELHHQDPLRPECRIDVLHVPPASEQETGADKENDGERKLRHHQRPANPTSGRSARDTSATLLAGRTQVAAHGRDRWRQSHQDSRQERDDQRPAESAEIEAHLIQTKQVARPEGTDEANAGDGEQCAHQSGEAGEQDGLSEELSDDSFGTRSKRSPNGHLARAGDAARQRQARDVGGGDQEHAKYGAAEHPQRQARLRSHDVKAQWDDADAAVFFGRGQLIVEAAGDCDHLCLGLLERRRQSKSPNDGPHLSTTNALPGRVRFPHVGIESRDPETRRENADDLRRNAVEHDRRADRIVRACESRLPEAMTDQDEPLPLLGFVSRKAASQRGLDPEE
jgi:hypothetical protein